MSDTASMAPDAPVSTPSTDSIVENAAMNADSGNAVGTWLGFELAGERYAVPLADVREVIRPDPPTPVPGAPAEVLGIVSLRGTIVTVLDGRRRLGLDDTANGGGPGQRVVVFQHEHDDVGILVDALQDVLDLDLDSEELMPPPPGRASCSDDPVLGVLTCGEGFVTLLDAGKLCRPCGSAMEAST